MTHAAGFREKSLWVTLTALLLAAIAGVFLFTTGLPTNGADTTTPALGPLGAAVVLLIVALAVGHSIVAVTDRRTAPDRRDRRIARAGQRVGARVMFCGVWVSLCTAWLTHGNAAMTAVLLAAVALAHATQIAAQLLLYRRTRYAPRIIRDSSQAAR